MISILLLLFLIFLFSGDFVRLGGTALKVAAVVSLSVFIAGFWNRISVWSAGSGNQGKSDMLKEALSGFFSKECFFAYRLFQRSAVRGIILVLTMWSFMILTFGSVALSLEYTLRTDLTSSRGFSLLMDWSGAILLFCLLFYLARRLVVKSARIIALMDDVVLLLTFFFVVLSGFAVEGLRIAYAGVSSESGSPFGSAAARFILSFSDRPEVLLKIRGLLWHSHALLVFFFFAYIPFSKQFHMFAAQITTKDAERREKQLRRILHE